MRIEAYFSKPAAPPPHEAACAAGRVAPWPRGGGRGAESRGRGPRAARPARALAVLAAAALALAAAAAAPWAGEPDASPAPTALFPPPPHIPALLPAADAAIAGKCTDHGADRNYWKPPTIQFASPDRFYFLNETVEIRVNAEDGVLWSHLSEVASTRLELETGGTDRFALHAGNNAQNAFKPFHVNYSYTVREGDASHDLDYKETASLYWKRDNGENILSAYNFPHNCFLPEPGAPGSLGARGDIKIIGFRPSTVALADPLDGVYGAGREVAVSVYFSEAAAYSGGAPELVLNVSGEKRTAAYKSGNGTAEFVFIYVVQPGDAAGDLDYYGVDSLTGTITNGTGHLVNRTLREPGAPGSLSGVSDIWLDPAALPLIPSGRAGNDANGFDALDGATDVDAIAVGNRTYAVVASFNDDAVQLIRVHGDGTLEAAHSVSGGGRTGPVLDYAHGIDAFYMGGGAYAIVAAHGSNGGVQLLRIHGNNGTLSTVSSLPDYNANNALELHGAIGVAAFEMNNTMHALVASYWDDGIQLLRIDAATGALSRVSSLAISRAHDAAVFDLGGEKHAIVTSRGGAGSVHLVSINATTGMLASVDSLADNATLALGNPHRVSTFDLGGTMHALVASKNDNGIQLIRIDSNGTLVPAGSASDGERGFAELGGAEGLTSFTGAAGAAYALVASRGDNGVQLVHVRGGGGSGALASAGWAADGWAPDGDPSFAELEGAAGVAAFSMGGHRYAIVSSIGDDGVQLVRLSAASVVNVTSTAPNGTYSPGDAINITVAFDHPVRVLGPVELRLNSGGAAAYRSGNNTDELAFRYEVGPGDSAADLGHAGGGAPFAGGSIRDGALPDLLVGRALPAPGTGRSLADLKDIAVETPPPPLVASVSSPNSTGPHGIGAAILVNVTFSRPVSVEGSPLLEMDAGGAGRNATYAPEMSGGASLLFEHAVRRGDSSPGLAYAGPSALHLNGSTIAGTAYGLAANLTLPAQRGSLSAQGAVAVDGIEPRIASVTSPDANGTYGAGTTINITVGFTEPVSFEPAGARPEVPLDTGGGAGGGETRRAVCAPGATASAELACAYGVRAGDATADLGYGTNTSLVLGSGAAARDAAGNALASPALLPDSPAEATLNGSKDIALDTAVPAVLRVASPDANGTYGRGSEIRIDVVFDGDVEIHPEPLPGDASAPTLRLETGEIDRTALYANGSGTAALRFVYTVVAGDFSADLNYTSAGALSLGHRALVDGYGNREQSPALPDPGSAGSLGGQRDIAVRTVPTVDAVRANYTDTFLKVGQTVGVRVQFSEKVSVDPAPGGAVPYIELDTGRPGAQARAFYTSGSGSHALAFSYPVHPADSTAALDYSGTGALKDNGAAIRGAGAGANLTLPAPGPGGPLALANIELRPNEAPEIGPLPNRTVGVGVELHVDVAADDPEGQPVAFSLAGAPEGAEIDSRTGALAWTPTEQQRSAQGVNSTYSITVRATDPHMASDTAGFAVTVVETPPDGYEGPAFAAIPDAEGREGEEIRFDIAVADDSHGPFTYSLAADADPPPPAGAALHPNGTFSWTPGYGQSGTHSITARAADRYGLDGNRSFSVSVLDAEPPWNLPPAIEPVDPQSADEGERLVVRISAADPDGPITYSLAGSPPDGAAIDPATGVFTWDIGYDAAGTHTVTVSAADRYNRMSSLDFAVTVADRVPPSLPPEIGPIPAQRVAAGTALALRINATDPNEGDALSFSLVGPPPGAAITADGGLFTWTPGLSQVGRHVLNVTVADGGGLSDSAPLVVVVDDPAALPATDTAAAAAEAVFVGPRAVRIDYNAPLGPPAGHAGPVYGGVTIGGGGSADPAAVSGLGTCTHIVRLEGDAAGIGQDGAIRLLADLGGAADGILYRLAAGTSIPVVAGEAARMLSPSCMSPVAAIEADGFVRGVNATAAGAGARPAINVTSLAAGGGGGGGGPPAAPGAGIRVALPADIPAALVASFAEVRFPPGATARGVPADGLIKLHIADRAPAAEEVAGALGIGADDVLEVLAVVEVGDSRARIEFDMPVRILLVGQAGGRAFYVDGASGGGGVAPIRTACAADDAAAVHAQLAGGGECWLDRDGGKVVYTYHLTGFGTAAAPTALEAMVAGAAAGGIVRVPAGTYAEDVLVVDKPLTIEPADPEDPPVLTGYSRIAVASPPQAGAGAGGGGGPVAVRGLVFRDTTLAPDGSGGLASISVEPGVPGAAAPAAAAMPVTIEGNTFRNTCGTAVRAAAPAAGTAPQPPLPPIAGLTVKDNRFYDIGGNRANCGVAAAAAGGGALAAAAELADAIVAGRHVASAGGNSSSAAPAAPQLAGMAVLDNYIFGTTYTGIRIAGADGLAVTGNHIEGVPDDGVRIMQSRNVQVHLNTIVGANQAPRSPAASAAEAPHDGLAGAAIEVWSGSDGVDVTLNRISESAGAFLMCAGECDPGPNAANGTGGAAAVPVAAVPVNAAGGSAAGGIRFSHNVLAESNTGVLVANAAGGELDARANYYPGYADSAAERASPAGAVLLEPALGYAGPVRIGAVVADGPSSPIRSVDAAVRAAFELGVLDFNAAQARDGGAVGLEPAVRAVDSPDYTAAARAAHASAVSALLSGSSADARMLPVLHNSISSAMALYDASSSGAAGLAAISAMGATHAHYPFVLDRSSGAIVAHGADASLAGGYDNDGAGPSAATAAAGLLDFSPPDGGAGAGGTGVDPGHQGAPWKWRAHESVNPATNASEPKRSVLALHPGPDGAAHTDDDLVFGAGYHPGPGAAHLVVAAGDAAAAAAETGAIVAISPASTASQLAARDALFRLAPPDAKLAGVVVAQALADRQGAAAAAQPVTIVALNDSASLQSASLAGELYEIDLQGALPDGVDRVAVVSYNSSSPAPPAGGSGGAAGSGSGAEWAPAAADLIRAAASESRGDAAVVYSGRAGAFAALAEALGGQPPPNTRWYSTGELARAELAASGPDAASLARAGQLAAVLQRAAAPNAAIDAALAAPGIGIVLDESTRGPAYAAYDAPALLGRAMALTPGIPGAPAAVARAIGEDVARTHAGALGSPLILDRNGDLVLPIAYAVSAFPAGGDPGGAWGQLDTIIGERSCGIALAKGALDFGILSLGRYSRPDTQTVINTGTLPYRSVTLDPGDWTYASGQTLPASITELRELGRAAAYAGAASGFVVAPGLEPGQDRNVQFRINLTAYQSLPPGEASQTINYLVECRAAAAAAG